MDQPFNQHCIARYTAPMVSAIETLGAQRLAGTITGPAYFTAISDVTRTFQNAEFYESRYEIRAHTDHTEKLWAEAGHCFA